MIFIYKKWEKFCRELAQKKILSVPAREISAEKKSYLVLKHDVETDVKKAWKIAKIESAYGHRGSYYVQAYLLKKKKNVELLLDMQKMGHEISYHYDVMDSNKGDIERAIIEFEQNRRHFEDCGFRITTVCQHGNPILDRVGYTSNRDFFRNEKVQSLYPLLADIMVDYKQKRNIEYQYYSDAGRQFKWIYDPVNNDVVNSEKKNIAYKDLNRLLESLNLQEGNIISIHPHRWSNNAFIYLIKTGFFKFVRFIAKLLIKIPFVKKFFSKYYYLAKKI